MTYQNKYLKYKNKYLDLKKIFGGAESTNPATLDEWVKYWDNKNFSINYDISNNIKKSKTKKYNVSNLYIQKGTVDPTNTFILIFLQSLKDFNITGNLTIVNITIKKLPDLFCNIIIGGDLNLSHTQLRTLPENFRQIKVGGHLNLSHNQLITLPESFRQIKVGGHLNLSHNQLITLPESFGNILVHGDLNLSVNQLTTLPESFGNMSVHGDLNLSVNQLTTLPNFVNIKIGRHLFLQYNKLEQLPDIFNINIHDDLNNISHSIKVNGGLFLNDNKLKTLPESFGNMIVQGDLNLSHNQLKQLPDINYMYIEGKFNLFKNQLYEFPTNFSNIYVKDLNLGENNLMELPDNFGEFECVGDLNLSHNLLKVLPSNFGEIHVGGDLNLSYNLLKILPTNFEHVGKKILLNNNYIISSSPINCVRKPTQKNYCHLDNQTIEGSESYEENKKCSNCLQITKCKKCAICKNEWYCSEDCEKEEWHKLHGYSHRSRCNNIINTTFIISAHGVMEHSDTPIAYTYNLSIITLSLLGNWTYFYLNEPLSDIYTNNNSLFNDNDKTLTLTDSGNNFNKTYKGWFKVNLMNRLNNENKNFNNISLHFDDDREFVKKQIRNHCFRKYENKENIEKIDDYLYNRYNNKIVNSVDLINHIVDNERTNNYNMGHITFIFIACRGLPKFKDEENKIMRANSLTTQMNTNNALDSEDIVNKDILAEKHEKEKAEKKQKKEELENTFASQSENQFNNSKILIDNLENSFLVRSNKK